MIRAISVADPGFGRAYAQKMKSIYMSAIQKADPGRFWSGNMFQDWADEQAREIVRGLGRRRRRSALKGWHTRRKAGTDR